MNKLDPHTLFSLFEQGDVEVYKEHGVEDVLKNPYVILNMVSRGIDNYQLMDMLYVKNYGENYKRVRSLVQKKYFVKMYNYLDRLDTGGIADSGFDIGESYELPSVVVSIDVLRMYFESQEMYENCKSLKELIELLYDKAGTSKFIPNGLSL